MHPFYGSEYPLAVVVDGIRMPLKSERRFARFYENEVEKRWAFVSRFCDQSASITLSEISTDWSKWSTRDRSDFCLACSFLSESADFPDMIRVVLREGTVRELSLIAPQVASHLPREEAIKWLSGALSDNDPVNSINIRHALSRISENES